MTAIPTQGEDNIAIITRLYAHFLKGEWDAVIQMLHPDFQVVEADSLPYGGRHQGTEGLMKVVYGLGSSFDNIQLYDFDVIGSGDTVVGLFTFQANARSTGRPIKMRFCEHWELKNGEITLLEPFYFDTHAIHEALKV